MNASELASFRTLLQAQALPPPDRGLFARMRTRLSLVERAEPSADAPPSLRPAASTPRLATVSWDGLGVRLADPLPSTPPVFGRRELGPEPEAEAAASSEASPAAPELTVVRLKRPAQVEEAHTTPDELAAEPSPSSSGAPSPGKIAGWSHVRPASAQQRILQRLEAVFTAELQGLDARIAADTFSG